HRFADRRIAPRARVLRCFGCTSTTGGGDGAEIPPSRLAAAHEVAIGVRLCTELGSDNVIMGIELSGWYVLAKVGSSRIRGGPTSTTGQCPWTAISDASREPA